MMLKSMLIVLLVSSVLVMHTEAGWIRRAVRNVGRVAKKVTGAVGKIPIGPIRGPARVAHGLLGKRSVAMAPCPPQTQQDMQYLSDIKKDCPTWGIDPSMGLNRDVLDDAFLECDVDKDGILNGNELEMFENIIESYSMCVDMLLMEKKQPNGL